MTKYEQRNGPLFIHAHTSGLFHKWLIKNIFVDSNIFFAGVNPISSVLSYTITLFLIY